MSDWSSADEPGAYYGPPPTQPHVPGNGPYDHPQWSWSPPAGSYAAYPQPGGYPPAPPYASAYGPPAPGEGRPGTLLAAAVLGYVTAALLIVAGLLLAFSVSLLDDLLDGNSFTAEFTLACLANFAAAGLLIGGSVAMTARNRTGRRVYTAGAATVLALTVYWLARWAASTGREVLVVYGLFFATLAAIGLALAYVGGAGRWLARS